MSASGRSANLSDDRAAAAPSPVTTKLAEAATPLPLIGESLGPYRIVARIGEGGMGTVYAAEHTLIGRKVAIKLLNADVSTDNEAVSRFFTEARAVNQIRHPNIVEVTDLGENKGRYFIVMEYLEGETLGARLTKMGLFDEVGVVNVGRQVASALGAAHGLGMVHRDLKPANIFLREHPDYPDFVKVLDFGIAKLLTPGPEVAHQTRVGTLIGTPAYMSPEQCLGEANLDHRSDIYSLGVVLYGMLTGQLPFKDAPLGQMIMAQVTETPRAPHEINSHVTRAMSAVIMKSLAKRPDDRYQTMRDLRQALDAVVGYVRTPTPMAVPVMMSAREPSGPRAPQAGHDTPAPATVVANRVVTTAGAVMATPASSPKDDALVDKLVNIVRERIASNKLDVPPITATTRACLLRLRVGSPGFGEMAVLVSQSPALSSRVIRLANSVAFVSRAPAVTLEQSVGRLGELGLEQALIEFEARPVLDATGKDTRVKELFRRPWFHALATALAATRLAQTLGHEDLVVPLHLAGIMQAIGKPVIASFLLGVERQTAGTRGPRWMTDEIWMRAVLATSKTVAGMIAREWLLPELVLTAIDEADSYRASGGRAGTILRLAVAYADKDGFYLRKNDQDVADVVIAEGRKLLAIDDKAEQKVMKGLKDRVALLAGIRGA